MSKILLKNDPNMFVLFEDESGRALMTVTVGGVAMSDVTVQLTGDEARELAADEDKAVELARQIATRTSVFEERRLRPAVLPR